jgi:hypothetical protein
MSDMGLSDNQITKDLVQAFGGTYLLVKYRTLTNLLKTYGIRTIRETKVTKSQQILLGIVKQLLGKGVDAHFNYKHHDLRFAKSERILRKSL